MDWFQATTTSLLPIMMPPPAGAPSTCFFVYYFVDGDKLSFILYNNIYEKKMLRVGHCHVCQFLSSRGRVPYPHIYSGRSVLSQLNYIWFHLVWKMGLSDICNPILIVIHLGWIGWSWHSFDTGHSRRCLPTKN